MGFDPMVTIKILSRTIHGKLLMLNFVTLAFFLLISFEANGSPNKNLAADLSFLVADLKYSEKEGVKICEIQPGSLSKFSGYDFILNDQGHVAKSCCAVLERFQSKIWFVKNGICDPKMKKEYLLRGYIQKLSVADIISSKEFKDTAKLPLYDPSKLNAYAGAVYSSLWFSGELAAMTNKYPSILVIDRAFIPFFMDKEKMSSLFLDDPDLLDLKPRWRSYPKHYYPELAKEILEDMASDTVVIKPIRSTKGHGVLIVAAEDLDTVLKQLFLKKNSLPQCKDEEYRHWATDTSPRFIVEAFHASDPVFAPLLGEGSYDPTMRIVFFLIYDGEEMEIVFVEGHWKLPKISLEAEGSLTLKHKSYGEIPHFLVVDDAVLKKVEEQLKEQFLLFYKRALNIDSRGWHNEIPEV